MDQQTSFQPDLAIRRGPALRTVLLAGFLAFVLGVALTVLLVRWQGDGPVLRGVFDVRAEADAPTADPPATASPELIAAPVPSPSSEATAAVVAAEAREAVARVEAVAEQQGGLDSRVAAMEQRLARLDLAAEAAAGNAARAEALLIAFAARRAIDRGAPLGYLADQLRLRFGDARPNAVQTIIAASEDPVTVDELLARLDRLAPSLREAPAEEGVISRVRRELGQVFVVRREATPSPAADRRLARARLFLESGRIAQAVAEIRFLPNLAPAGDWLADASRLAAAHQALDLLETAAVLDPRDLRDINGERVEQPSPAG